jgi:uncharacterized membrane protein
VRRQRLAFRSGRSGNNPLHRKHGFVYLHLAVFGVWILINLGLVPGVGLFDPSFVILAMVAAVEAIFLSTFVLISQNRMAASDAKRAELDLQISLLAEHDYKACCAGLCYRRSHARQDRCRPRGRRTQAGRRTGRSPGRNRGEPDGAVRWAVSAFAPRELSHGLGS